ncbi:GNAT family N-acetyltransferase [Nonomuraea dietziae]|uniref:GNAT family N-acetyltransferase n=1 Tax=Nonomuraea dietziae TaxID=65515 RepID=UPI0031DA0CC2
MDIQRIDLDRPGDLLAGLHDAHLAAFAHLQGPRMSLPDFTRMVSRGLPGDLMEAWAVVEDGVVVAGYGLELPMSDNTHLGRLRPLLVRPGRRRRGLGTALLAHAADRLRTAGPPPAGRRRRGEGPRRRFRPRERFHRLARRGAQDARPSHGRLAPARAHARGGGGAGRRLPARTLDRRSAS